MIGKNTSFGDLGDKLAQRGCYSRCHFLPPFGVREPLAIQAYTAHRPEIDHKKGVDLSGPFTV